MNTQNNKPEIYQVKFVQSMRLAGGGSEDFVVGEALLNETKLNELLSKGAVKINTCCKNPKLILVRLN